MTVAGVPHAPSLNGRIVAIRGTVIDVAFTDGLPSLETSLRCTIDHGYVDAFVHSHLGDWSVRAIAIDSTRGLSRGAAVTSDGSPLQIPVGKEVIGRVIDLRGRPLDGAPPCQTKEVWPLHAF